MKRVADVYVERTCTRLTQQGAETTVLAELRSSPAYILLGEPGSGKSREFRRQAELEGTRPISARDFIDLPLPSDLLGKPLFIDGLDEMRAGTDDGRKPLSVIRAKLVALDKPCFRISCREADWLGETDTQALNAVADGGKIAVVHLNDLSETQIAELLQRWGVADPTHFIAEAKDKGLDELLGNPLNLDFLYRAVDSNGGTWPTTREQTFASACNELAQEHNPEHQAAKRKKAISTKTLLDTAGHLFAILLLSGCDGLALKRSANQPNYSPLDELGIDLGPTYWSTLESRLFEHGQDTNLRRPKHRAIAEYLGARYLAQKISRQGFPLGRVLALMGNPDGSAVAGLRGLHAWLAVHCLAHRRTLIERDPLAVVLYGDAQGFSTEDKSYLLQALQTEVRHYRGLIDYRWKRSPFGALGTRDMVAHLRAYLTQGKFDETSQHMLECVLDAIKHGEAMPGLVSDLLRIVGDANYFQFNRVRALEALLRQDSFTTDARKALLESIRRNEIEDDDDELLGKLLHDLFPKALNGTELAAYLHPRKKDHLIGNYAMFLEYQFFEAPLEAQYEVLNALVSNNPFALDHDDEDYDFHSKGFIGQLLANVLEAFGTEIELKQLEAWLALGLGKYGDARLEREPLQRIERWLSDHPEVYKALLLNFLTECAKSDKFNECMFRKRGLLYGVSLPTELAHWALEQSSVLDSEEAAQYLFDNVIGTLGFWHSPEKYPLEEMENWIAKNTRFKTYYEEHILQVLWHKSRQDQAKRKHEHEARDQSDRATWVAEVKKHLGEIRAGKGPAHLVNGLAKIHQGLFYGLKGETPKERLLDFFEQNEAVVQAILSGFSECVARSDLPEVDAIVASALKGKEHFVRLPCLVGMEQRYRLGKEAIFSLSEQTLLKMLVFRFTYGIGDTPGWVAALAHTHPQIVAKAALAYVIPAIKARNQHIGVLYDLDNQSDWAEVAALVAPAMLEAIPTRISSTSLNILEHILKLSAQHARSALERQIASRIKQRGLDVQQKVIWLAAGTLLDLKDYAEKLERYVDRDQKRASTLSGYLGGRGDLIPHRELPESTLGLFIRLLGPHASSERKLASGFVTEPMRVSENVSAWINQLAGRPGEKAKTVLVDLLSNKALSHWHAQLGYGLDSQRVVTREASYVAPSATAVAQSLANGKPASATDLAALVQDHLLLLAQEIRHGNTNSPRRFWIGDSPANENDCRDYLLELLRPQLTRLQIEAQPEERYAREKRADIRVSFNSGQWAVPVEIKKDRHAEVWRAMRSQLMGFYAPDPDAQGCGIYLVLWFGGGRGMPMPPIGARPTTAEEMNERLLSLLTPEERYRIRIVVLDVTR